MYRWSLAEKGKKAKRQIDSRVYYSKVVVKAERERTDVCKKVDCDGAGAKSFSASFFFFFSLAVVGCGRRAVVRVHPIFWFIIHAVEVST